MEKTGGKHACKRMDERRTRDYDYDGVDDERTASCVVSCIFFSLLLHPDPPLACGRPGRRTRGKEEEEEELNVSCVSGVVFGNVYDAGNH